MELADRAHIVNLIPPQSLSGDKESAIFSAADYEYLNLVVTTGEVSDYPGTITVEECDAFVSATCNPIAFNYYATSAGGESFGTRQLATVAGFDVATSDNNVYFIDIDHSELKDGYPYLKLKWTSVSATCYGGAHLVATGARYSGASMPVVLLS